MADGAWNYWPATAICGRWVMLAIRERCLYGIQRIGRGAATGGKVGWGAMDVIVGIVADSDCDEEELAGLAGRLRSEMLGLDVLGIEPVIQPATPDGAKGAGEVLGWLLVHLGGESLRTVVAAVADWALRNDRSVEVDQDGDVLKLGRATREQQEKIVDAWLTRHSSGT
jgi:hypothetical protein